MIRSRFLRSSVLVLSAFVALSCSDVSPTAPSAPVASAVRAGTQQDALLGGLLGGLIGGVLKTVLSIVGFVAHPDKNVRAVAWSPAYANHTYSVSGTISYRGGTITIPQSDFTITFPVGAVSQPTLITITSDPTYVAYKMLPSPKTFAKPLVVTQLLRHTAVYGQPLTTPIYGAYVDDAPVGLLDGLFKALEIELSATLSSGSSRLPELTTWTVNHFSRYMLASG
jgi:hypothetical protein